MDSRVTNAVCTHTPPDGVPHKAPRTVVSPRCRRQNDVGVRLRRGGKAEIQLPALTVVQHQFCMAKQVCANHQQSSSGSLATIEQAVHAFNTAGSIISKTCPLAERLYDASQRQVIMQCR